MTEDCFPRIDEKGGNCYDNAPMESFRGTIKNELIHHRRYRTREEAIRGSAGKENVEL